jgi:hypothetical protein
MSFFWFYLMWAGSTWFGLMYHEKYCRDWDKALGVLLDMYAESIKVDKYTSQLGHVEVWTSNAFYSYGHAWRADIPCRRPGIWNMYRLWFFTRAKRRELIQREHENYLSNLARVVGHD